ncbi:uncharacterized protein [Magallana gigas]|uniref:uncharacterized protein n=1 Tax=Magallana gigas TaxID=29159 RepID=UPI00333EA25D
MEIIKEVFVKSPIARQPPNGYQVRIPFSRKSIAWLELLMQRARTNGQHLDICHALNGRGEYRVPETPYRLDGYVAPTTEFPAGIAYEFHGCRFHGCPACFKNGGDILLPNSEFTASELLARTCNKERKLKSLGMKLVVIWEHEYDNMIKEDPDAKTFVENLDLTERLDPGIVLWLDTARYPTGHPEIITREFDDISKYFGLAKVKDLPLRGLFHPVLGYRSQGKLTFPLCRSCVERQQKEPCACSDADRALTGTYGTPEILKAVEKGYKILKIYEVYHWGESTQYDSVTKTGGLFAPYINMFLKIKQEASGRPDWIKTEDDLAQYIEMYEQREGIRLDPDNIEHNPGLRSLAKLLLNRFWGKFGQRMNLCKTQILHDSQAHVLFEQMANPTIEIQDFNIIDDNHFMLSTKRASEDMCDPGHSNVFLASFTTCRARLKLYELLDLLQTRVLYWDTDSVIYTQKEGEIEPTYW